MKYLLDTNVVSELRKRNCNRNVRVFMESLQTASVFMSVISMGEIAFGIRTLKDENKKAELLAWFETQLPQKFRGRIVAIDSEVMITWGNMCADHKATLPSPDSFIAATALTYNLTILTRNTKDFETIQNISLLNPWEQSV
jgi:predicted nucleic acid-binding protein